MEPSQQDILADVAVVFSRDPSSIGRGSGRLVAPDLVLTSRHVVDGPSSILWKVRLLREAWDDPPHDARLIWQGQNGLDLALLALVGKPGLSPTLELIFAAIHGIEPIESVFAVGFPEARDSNDEAHDYSAFGNLRSAALGQSYTWSVAPADKPDHPNGWQGMSGASVCCIGLDEKLNLFGAVQEVPANFTFGQLDVARVSEGFRDEAFREHLRAAFGIVPTIVAFRRATHVHKDARLPRVNLNAGTFVQTASAEEHIEGIKTAPQGNVFIIEDNPLFVMARKKAESMRAEGRAESASRVLMTTLENVKSLCVDGQKCSDELQIQFLEEAIFYDKTVRAPKLAYAKLEKIAALLHPGDRKQQRDYLESRCDEYYEQGTLRLDNEALLLAVIISRNLLKEKNDAN